MRQKLILLWLLVFLPLFAFAQDELKWQEQRSTHFIVYYRQAPEDFIHRVSEKAEDYYNNIADNLGFTRLDFWLWDKRAKIYIYDDAKDFQVATGQPAWSVAVAVPGEKAISSFVGQENFLERILPHEVGHIILREFVGFNNYALPVWLEEGVASFQEKPGDNREPLIREAIRTQKLMDLEGLNSFNPQLNRDSPKVELFYAESASIVSYLIREFGKDSFVLFCQNLRDRKNLESALRATYPLNNLKELDEKWQKSLGR